MKVGGNVTMHKRQPDPRISASRLPRLLRRRTRTWAVQTVTLGEAAPAAVTNSAEGGTPSVTIWGQRKHASLPSCAHQRQLLRTPHCGSVRVTAGSNFTVRFTSW